ncbi:hypothetical protein BU24DRAFT_465753 [Aaosphaeria arxii CBS 175.79]|uniref:Uncharacterized protein n=1 Tax=Aaosphaeria arxii CBS 175.79 TaxID=1450172 RepID=A0A6A5XHB2_9PLEO|nr:uncharacterized protein BU24DRAFT_465753 [Aaosphaeria arxii CBS 175.79]KAF2012191.1 hypothetical protein BU24DRAFT_465753 [Aaosphaeria arxii CBS 175.79]
MFAASRKLPKTSSLLELLRPTDLLSGVSAGVYLQTTRTSLLLNSIASRTLPFRMMIFDNFINDLLNWDIDKNSFYGPNTVQNTYLGPLDTFGRGGPRQQAPSNGYSPYGSNFGYNSGPAAGRSRDTVRAFYDGGRVAQHGPNGRYANAQNNGGENNDSSARGSLQCTWCGMHRHTEEYCWNKRDGRPRRGQNENRANYNTQPGHGRP